MGSQSKITNMGAGRIAKTENLENTLQLKLSKKFTYIMSLNTVAA